MSIKYDPALNEQIRSIVRNYNKRRNRLEKRGFIHLPPPVKVSELKSRYEVRSQLVKELNRLKNLGAGEVLRQVETEGGVKAVEWKYKYLKNNLNAAKEYFTREYERISKRAAKFPGEKEHVFTVQNKLSILDLDINYMNQKQFRAAVSAVNEYAKSPTRIKNSYRGFLSEVDMVMDRLNIDKETRDRFFNKFKKLTPTQFLYAYDNNDIIGRIYDLADSPEYGGIKLNTTKEDAKDLIDVLMEEADDIVANAKLKMD